MAKGQAARHWGGGPQVGPDGAQVDGVDSGAEGQLVGPDPGEGLQGGLGAGVEAHGRAAGGGGERGDVDDAAGLVGGQVGLDWMNKEEARKGVDGVDGVDVGLGDVPVGLVNEGLVDRGNAGVVDSGGVPRW